ncbi:MAG: glycosyltransferase family protein [Caulobacter sp.]|nr:glycosyltransferase family protein [Caulobacter sp.]
MVLAILQARMSSTRLPGKVMADVAGAPMILRQIERLKRAPSLQQIVVATSEQSSDDVLAQAMETSGVPVFRGSLDDVLGRFIGAIDAFGPAGVAMRLTADCPLADPDVIEDTLALREATGADYAANAGERRTFPKGLDVEVFKVAALRIAAAETDAPYDREHVTPFLYRRPERFALAFHHQAVDEGEVRWTVDRPDDLVFVRAVYDALYPASPAFSSDDIRAFVRGRPDLHCLGGDRRL